MMLYDLGARLDEITNIKLYDIHFTKETSITLFGKRRKERATPISDNTLRHLKKYISLVHAEPCDHNNRLFFTENDRNKEIETTQRRGLWFSP